MKKEPDNIESFKKEIELLKRGQNLLDDVVEIYKKRTVIMLDLIERAAEEIENCYGRETELSVELRNILEEYGI